MEQIALRIAAWMKETGSLSDDQEAVIVYSLVYIILSTVGLAGMMTLSWILGIPIPGMLCGGAAASLRLMSGGAHYSAPGRCAVMSSLTFPLLAWLALRLPTVSALPLAVGTLVFALIAVLLFAPVDNEARPIRPEQRPRFRIASLVVLGLWGLVIAIGPKPEYVLAISAGLAWQSLSLTPAGRFWYHGIDGIFSLVEGGDKV